MPQDSPPELSVWETRGEGQRRSQAVPTAPNLAKWGKAWLQKAARKHGDKSTAAEQDPRTLGRHGTTPEVDGTPRAPQGQSSPEHRTAVPPRRAQTRSSAGATMPWSRPHPLPHVDGARGEGFAIDASRLRGLAIVPEPSSAMLLLVGLTGLVALDQRRRAAGR